VGGHARRRHQYPPKRELLACVTGDREVPEVGRVERSSEYAHLSNAGERR
jgi:hypothetical protein